MAVVREGSVFLLLLSCFALPVAAQELPDDELQVTFNSYFDNFGVSIVYPTMSYTKRVGQSSSINARYLVDVISAASMRSHFIVDGVTSATEKEDGGGDDSPDEIRQEFGLGMSRLLDKGTLSVNGIYSTEHDYSSTTLATTYSYPFARKNTIIQVGLVRSWDKSFPQIRDWEKSKDIYTTSLNVTQVLNKRLIAQGILSYSYSKGLHSDPYQVVQIIEGVAVVNYEPVHPDRRNRKAIGVRMNYKFERKAALQMGVRLYWDDWDVTSFTTSMSLLNHLSEAATVGLGFRSYFQSAAYFFKEEYAQPEQYMTVDSKLDKGFSHELQFKLTLNGGHFKRLPLLSNRNTALNFKLNFYYRQTDSPNWHRRTKELFAYIMSLGIRHRF